MRKPARASPTRIFTTQRAIRAGALTRDQKLVLMMLTTYMGKGGGIFPAVATIAKDCDLGESTTHRVISALVAAGWLERQPQHDPWGRPTSNSYKITPPPELMAEQKPAARKGRQRYEDGEPWGDFDGVPEDEAAQ